MKHSFHYIILNPLFSLLSESKSLIEFTYHVKDVLIILFFPFISHNDIMEAAGCEFLEIIRVSSAASTI